MGRNQGNSKRAFDQREKNHRTREDKLGEDRVLRRVSLRRSRGKTNSGHHDDNNKKKRKEKEKERERERNNLNVGNEERA